ncbi:MAG: hypothetical protein IJR52_00905 [Selenomonadaceae bacterium]|nr:hypothetical protein [Selenomonadaceae bacterium]MBQ9496113.1 hypothetical protein [Selenomonadaceae bacterium]
MNDLPRFIKIGEERINVDEIVSYGFAEDEDEERYLYVGLKTSDDVLEYYEDDVDFDLDEKIAELDDLFLIK